MANDALLDRMRSQPISDWSISDVEKVCREFNVRCVAPSGGGSHFKLSHPSQREILTVPFRRPIKAGIYPQTRAFHRRGEERKCGKLTTPS